MLRLNDSAACEKETEIDAGRMEQAITHPLCRRGAGDPDGGRVDVEVLREHTAPPSGSGGPAGEWIAVRVRDQGGGIAPEHLPHIFEPFYTTKDVGSGTGLRSVGRVRDRDRSRRLDRGRQPPRVGDDLRVAAAGDERHRRMSGFVTLRPGRRHR